MEKTIEKLEAEQADLLKQVSSAEPGLDYEGINKRLAAVQQKLSDANSRWEAYAIELDELEQEYHARR